MKYTNSSTRHLYWHLFLLLGVAFAALNIVGYGLKWCFFPTHLKEGVVEEFLFPIKLGDINHAIELLSSDIVVIENSGGKKIGIASDKHFWSFRELALCEIDEVNGQYYLTNGAAIEVTSRKRVSIRVGERVFPWNEKTFLTKDRSEKIAITIKYIRDNIDDDCCWLFGINELRRLTGKEILSEISRSRDEREGTLKTIQKETDG